MERSNILRFLAIDKHLFLENSNQSISILCKLQINAKKINKILPIRNKALKIQIKLSHLTCYNLK